MKTPATRSAPVLFFVAALALVGLIFVFDSSGPESYAMYGSAYVLTKQHLIGLVVGSLALLVGLITPVKWLLRFAPIVYGIGVLLLLLVLIPGVGISLNGAQRWILIGGVSIQPVEFFKFSLIIFMASWLPKHQKLSALAITLAVPAILLLLQPDVGSMLVVIAIACSMYIMAGGSVRKLGFFALAAIPLLGIIIAIEPYRLQRITTFFNPESDPLGSSFHVRQITLALGRGGIFGQGLGNSSQKFSYVPEASTDSIAAIIGEETGFVGLLIVIALYIGLLRSGYRLLAPVDGAERLVGLGILSWITAQVLLNLAAVAALVPLTGIPLPFISYGRSSLVMLLYGVGILLHIRKARA
jgi:cell division protein FtsW